ncbi:MAG: AMP-binding protein, partial [Clostridia bacterium]|nr:AMP-binding protein [Clostridia bacterium]
IYFCGEVLDPKTVRKLWERFPSLEIINAYGPTEATSAVSAVQIRKEMLDKPLLPAGDTANSAVEIEIDDGEIILKGKSVFSGYLNGITGGYFRENGQNCYRTGDLGYIENNLLYCRGRKDSQIKYKGYRIELSDIEQNISELEGVQDCLVTASRTPDGTIRYLSAYVTGESDCLKDLRERISMILPDYMIPKNIRLLDRLPVNANGKTDRKALCND